MSCFKPFWIRNHLINAKAGQSTMKGVQRGLKYWFHCPQVSNP